MIAVAVFTAFLALASSLIAQSIGGGSGGSGVAINLNNATIGGLANVLGDATTITWTDPGLLAVPSSGIKEQVFARAGLTLKHSLPAAYGGWVKHPSLMSNYAVGCHAGLGATIASFGVQPHIVVVSTTQTNSGVAPSSVRSSMRGVILTSTIGTVEVYNDQNVVFRGNATGIGGFLFYTRIAHQTNVANQRAFFGLSSSISAMTGSDPSTIANTIYVGYDSGQKTLRACSNSSSTATCTDLGANYSVDTTAVYDIWITAAPNAGAVNYLVERLDSTVPIASGTYTSSKLPSSTTFLATHLWANNGGSGTVGFRYQRACIMSRF